MRLVAGFVLVLALALPAGAVTERVEAESQVAIPNSQVVRTVKELVHLQARRMAAEKAAQRIQAIHVIRGLNVPQEELPAYADALITREVAGEGRRPDGYWVKLQARFETVALKGELQQILADAERRQSLQARWANDDLFRQALTAQLQGNLPQAVEHYQRLSERVPRDAVVHNNLGTAYYQQGNFPLAEKHFRQAAELDPKHAEALSNLGNLLLDQLNQPDAAEFFLYRAVNADPNNSLAYTGLGNLALHQQMPDEAEVWLKKSLSLDPDNYFAHNSLGIVMAMRGRYAEAKTLFERALQLDPQHPAAKSNLERLKREMAP